jgi:hypothetical protein
MRQDANTTLFHLTAIAQQWPESLSASYSDPEVKRLLARTYVVIEATGQVSDYVGFRSAIDHLDSASPGWTEKGVKSIETIFARALARAELQSDMGGNTHFVGAGAEFSAAVAVKNIVSQASKLVRFIDPYAGMEILQIFGTLCEENIKIEVLADKKHRKPDLAAALTTWTAQYGSTRPVEIRLSPTKRLHDRAIFIDNSKVWIVGQSFNALATRSATSMVPITGQASELKLEAYKQLWAESEPLT